MIEDEPIIRQEICASLEEIGYAVAGVSDNAVDGLKKVLEVLPDAVLLDIKLSGVEDGIWLAHQINKQLNIPLIFITSYSDQDTLNSVKLERPHGYVLKPFTTEALRAAIEIGLARHRTLDAALVTTATGKKLDCQNVFVKTFEGWTNVPVSDIEYIETGDNYTFLHLTNQKRLIIRLSLKSFVSKMQDADVLRCHRRYAINLSKIRSINQNQIKLTHDLIPIGDTFKQALFDKLPLLT